MHMPIRPFAASVAAGALAALLGAAALVRAEPPSPESSVDASEAALGPIRTHRPSHAKGTCAAGEFVAALEGARLSVAPVFDGRHAREPLFRPGAERSAICRAAPGPP